MTALLAGPGGHARVVLTPGLALIDAVCCAMARLAWRSANLLILGGPLARAVYHTSILTPGGPRWIDYGPARQIAGPAWLVMGSATFGRGLDGERVLHCHGLLSGSQGAVGGHLSPELCLLGGDGLVAHATGASEAGFAMQHEPATGFDLFTPTCLACC